MCGGGARAMLLGFLGLVIASSCGGVAAPEVSAQVRISERLMAETALLRFYVMGPVRHDNILLTCSTLVLLDENHLEPRDELVDLLASGELDAETGSSATLSEVAAGEGRLVYVEAWDLSEVLIGNGCTDEVVVASNDEVQVTVDVYEVR